MSNKTPKPTSLHNLKSQRYLNEAPNEDDVPLAASIASQYSNVKQSRIKVKEPSNTVTMSAEEVKSSVETARSLKKEHH